MDSSKIINIASATRKDTSGRRETALNMRSDLVEKASTVIPEAPILINMVSKRVQQLNQGRPPLVQVAARLGQADIALMEIIEGKIVLQEQDTTESTD